MLVILLNILWSRLLLQNERCEILAGLVEGLNKMGGKPETAYTDHEPALAPKYTQQYFKEKLDMQLQEHARQ